MAEPNETATPKFDRPPVVETVLGVQFPPLSAMHVAHYGELWQTWKAEFPTVSEHPPLEPAIEQFGSGRTSAPAVTWSLQSGPPFPRCWFASEDGSKLIQVQRDRFLLNWRLPDPDGVYPGYVRNRDRFLQAFGDFQRCVDEQRIGAVRPNQCEVTYVNHVDVADGLNAAEMMHRLLTCWSLQTSDNWLQGAEVGAYNATFVVPGNRGRLHVDARPAIRKQDRREIIRLDLTARGAPAGETLKDMEEWLELGHEWVVRGFASLTTEEMHTQWGRTT